MPDKALAVSKKVSRRTFLYGAAAGGGVALGIGLVASPAAAKVPQTSVTYQPMPKGKSRCDNCLNWQPPSSCKLVDGAISPSGWCTLFHSKS